MSAHPEFQPIQEAAQKWAHNCLLNDGSVFTDQSLWTDENLVGLKTHFVDNLIEDDRKFFDKLKVQVSTHSKDLPKLTSEILWLLHLFSSGIKPQTKTEQITMVWQWSGDEIPSEPMTPIAFPSGIGKTGTAFNTMRWREVNYIWRIATEFKALPRAEAENILQQPWEFCVWLDKIDDMGDRQMRHILCYLLFPQTFERISVGSHKREIIKAFSNKLPKPLPESEVELSKKGRLDWQVHLIKQALVDKYPNETIDFYDSPIKDLWRVKATPATIVKKKNKNVYPTGKPRHWVISPGSKATLWQEFQDQGIAAIGWEQVGDLLTYENREALRELLQSEANSTSDFNNNTLALWQFSRKIKVGDTIYAKLGTSRIIGYGIVIQSYNYDDEREEFPHVIRVDWKDTREVELLEGTRVPIKTLTNIDSYRKCRERLESFYLDDAIDIPTIAKYAREDALADLFMHEDQFDSILTLLKRKKNIILQGPPGVGKTFVARRIAYAMMGEKNKSRAPMIQFHQSYAYEDFIQGYRPDGNGGFDLKNGIFHELCQEAQEDGDRDYFLIIDEINRGNLSKIFGELMMLIEHDKRSKSYSLQLTYSSEDEFYVPPNLHIIGTMNTADRSLSMVDYALRRRFSFISLYPEFESPNFEALLKNANATTEMIMIIKARLTNLNQTISKDTHNLGKGYRIGHSFFCPDQNSEATENWYRDVIKFEIAPLLREYWMDDEQKADAEIENLHL